METDGNVVAVEDGLGSRLIWGTTGFMIENNSSSAIIAFNSASNQVYIRSGNNKEKVHLHVQGNITFNEGSDLLTELKTLKEELVQLRKENAELREKLDMIYFAPGMPGYIMAEADFHSMMDTDETVDPYTK